MAANPVDISQLRVMADYFVNASYPYFEELRQAFKLLRLTGCRIQEIFEIERWSILSGYDVMLQPQKFNNPRHILLNSEFDSFILAIQNQYNPFLGRTYSQLQNLFSRINPYGKLYSGTKEITNYFFRYLFVRELYELGLTLEQIAGTMGYTSTTAVHNYLDADLTSTIPVPEPNTVIIDGIEYQTLTINGLKWMLSNLKNIPSSGDYKHCNNDSANDNDFGLLYRVPSISDIISSLPSGYRLPSLSDLNSLMDYLTSINQKISDLNNNSYTFWNTLTGSQLNILNYRGTGYISSNNPYSFKQFFTMALSDIPSQGFRSISTFQNIDNNSINTWSVDESNFYSAIRFVKDIV